MIRHVPPTLSRSAFWIGPFFFVPLRNSSVFAKKENRKWYNLPFFMSALCFLSNLIERISVCTRTMIYLGWYLKCVQLVSSAVKKNVKMQLLLKTFEQYWEKNTIDRKKIWTSYQLVAFFYRTLCSLNIWRSCKKPNW